MSSAIYYLIGVDDGGLWPWQRRLPSIPECMSASKLEAFFGKMAAQHQATLNAEPHVCEYDCLDLANRRGLVG